MYPLTMTFVIKEGTEERFKEAVRIFKEFTPKCEGLLFFEAFKSMQTRPDAPFTQAYVIIHAWESKDGYKQFVGNAELRKAAFSILDEIQVSSDIVHLEPV